LKKLKKDVLGHVKIGAVSGVGAMAVGAVGGSTAGLTTFSGFMPTVASVQGASGVFRQMKKLKKHTKVR
jgi:hypothetical protein